MGEFRYGLIIGVLVAAVVGLGLVILLDEDESNSPVAERPRSQEQPETRTPIRNPPSKAGSVKTEPTETKVGFRTPTGNIVCSVGATGATCGIREFDYRAPVKPGSCQLAGWGQFLGVDKTGRGQFLCADGIPADPWSPILRYGSSVRSGAFECSSATTGVRCRNLQTGHGFDLSREAFTTF